MEHSIKNILVPTDFSHLGNNAIRMAVHLCKQQQAVLHLLHVMENHYTVSMQAPGLSSAVVMSENEQAARSLLYNIYESILRDDQVPVQIHMPTGIPYEEICKTAAECNIDLVVMGTHGMSGFREFFMGSTAYSVIKNTTTPVLTIPGSYEKEGFDKILFPVRPVQGVKRKFNFIQQLLDSMSAVHVALLCHEDEISALQDHSAELNDIIFSLEHSGIACSKRLYTCNNVSAKVLEIAEVQSADLIVINATLDYKWTEFFMGPYTRQVVNRSGIPVLSFSTARAAPLDAVKKGTSYDSNREKHFSGL
jgi:nucleotide-binding universal stress UspA family protein